MIPRHPTEGEDPRPFETLRTTGLLWLINTVVFHPRGYALALQFDDDGALTGWRLLGDGSERIAFAEDGTEGRIIDDAFLAVKELLG